MNPLHAIEALRVAISNNDPHNVQFERPASTCGFDYAVWRFLNAWRSVSRPPGPDLVVLLRQVARWGQENILIGALPQWAEQHAERANISISPSGILQAVPFCPPWLTGDIVGRDEGLDAKPKFRRLDESLPGEPFLNSLNLSDSEYQRWNSHAQKEAAWMVLTAEARSTTLIALIGSPRCRCSEGHAWRRNGCVRCEKLDAADTRNTRVHRTCSMRLPSHQYLSGPSDWETNRSLR